MPKVLGIEKRTYGVTPLGLTWTSTKVSYPPNNVVVKVRAKGQQRLLAKRTNNRWLTIFKRPFVAYCPEEWMHVQENVIN